MIEATHSRQLRQVPSADLASAGLVIDAPPFRFRIRSSSKPLAEALFSAYSDYTVLDQRAFVDFDLSVLPVKNWRRFVAPLITLNFDGLLPFDPLPAAQAFPLLEWGMNWCVTSNAHQYLMCHSAVLARGDHALLLPAPPGSGKSTLCAALMLSGWRLLSDELALIEPETGLLAPFVRPVSLKNASIEVIGRRFSSAAMTRPVVDTIKGTVSHLKPSAESLAGARLKAVPRLLVFPKYVADSAFESTELSLAEGAVELARNAFNLPALGVLGFEALSKAVEGCVCYSVQYGNLDDVIAWLNAHIGQDAEAHRD